MIFIDSFPFTNGRPKATKKSEAHVIFNYANVLVAGRIFTGYEKEFSDLAIKRRFLYPQYFRSKSV